MSLGTRNVAMMAPAENRNNPYSEKQMMGIDGRDPWERKRNDNRNLVSSNESPLSPTLTLNFSGHTPSHFRTPYNVLLLCYLLLSGIKLPRSDARIGAIRGGFI